MSKIRVQSIWNTRAQFIGNMDFHGSVDITDPCYNRDVWCRMNDVKIKDGTYSCVVWKSNHWYKHEGKRRTYKRIDGIGIYYDPEGLNTKAKCVPYMSKDFELIGEIGVDAGVAGFFHNKKDFSREEWSEFSGIMSKGDEWLTEDGFWSTSGDGDGGYDVYAVKENDEIVAIEIPF